jgi:hypothetical protein
MALKKPDIYEHNNPDRAIADSDFVRGGIRSAVADLPALYALSSKSDQLKENATQVFVVSENNFYLLKSIANVGNSNGWQEVNFGNGGGYIENVVYTTGTQTITGPKNFTARPTLSGLNLITTGDLVNLELNIEGLNIEGLNNIVYTTGNQIITGEKTFVDNINFSGGDASFYAGEYIFSGTPVSFINSKPVVNGTGVLLSGEAVGGNGTITTMIKLTQAQYNALSPKDPTTFYVIVG